MILVTGGTGLLGAHLLYKLTAAGKRPRAIYRDPGSRNVVKKIFGYYSDEPGRLFDQIDWRKADLLDLPSMEEAMAGADFVYHCAGLVSMDPRDYKALQKVNIEGTANLVNLCLHLGVKELCHVSSIATLGKPVAGNVVNEQADLQTPVSNVYALSKHGAEMEVWRGSQEGLSVLVVNPGVILGPGFWNEGSGSIISQLSGRRYFYPPGGSGYIGVMDVAGIMIALAEKGIRNERFILVAENLEHRELMKLISLEAEQPPPKYKIPQFLLEVIWRLDWLRSRFSNKPRMLTRHRARTMRYRVKYDNSKLHAHLDWEYTPIAHVIKETYHRYREEV